MFTGAQPDPRTFGHVRDRLVQVGLRAKELESVVRTLGESLATEGLRPGRVNLAVLTLHPSLAGMGVTWTPDGAIATHTRPWGFLDTVEHRESPLHAVMSTGSALRLRLFAGEGEAFPIVRGFRAAGATDYVALPVPSMRGDIHVLSVWTDLPGGWSTAQIEALSTLLPTLALLVDTFESRRLARTVLETYLGPRTGPRVLAGQIHRGTSERIRAAVWFSDVRSFTDLTRQLGDEAIVHALDAWFEVAVGAVQGRDGEVLKFIGDALLAIFPVSGDDWTGAVDAAVEAAHAIRAEEERLSARRGVALRSGVAIHTGEVLYGNVGAPGRLDFTVLGGAVNKAARVSGLCGTLGESIVLSERAAQSCSAPLRGLGAFNVKGFPEAVELYAPA